MNAEQAARWLDMQCKLSMKMDESRKFDQCAGLIRAMAAVCDEAIKSHSLFPPLSTCSYCAALARLVEVQGD